MGWWICFFILPFCIVMYLHISKVLRYPEAHRPFCVYFDQGKMQTGQHWILAPAGSDMQADSMEAGHTSLSLIVNCRKEMQRYSY